MNEEKRFFMRKLRKISPDEHINNDTLKQKPRKCVNNSIKTCKTGEKVIK